MVTFYASIPGDLVRLMIEACWIQHAGETPWAQQIAQALRERDIHVKFVTKIRATHEEYLKNGFESYFISQIYGSREYFSEEDLAKLDQKYGPPLIKAIIDSDVHLTLLFGKDENKKKQIVAHAYKFWEQLLEEHPTDYFIVRETATFATRTAYNIARTRGKPLLMRADLGPDDSHFVMCDVGEEHCWQELLQAIEGSPEPITDAQKEPVLSFVEERTKLNPGPANIRGIVSLGAFPSRWTKSWLSEKLLKISDDPISIAAKRLERRFMVHRTLWNITRRLFPYHQPANEPYVYFPIYFEDEALTLANYRYWAKNTLSLVKEIAASLPEGYYLYVKEHPGVPGEISVSRLRALQKIPKVKVIDPLIQGQSLTKGCDAIIVLQGTAGWEAFLNRKPVIVLSADTFYSYSRLVYKVKDICKLSEILWEALSEGEAIYKRMENEWLWFIHCVLSSLSLGTFYTYEPPYFTPVNLENSKRIADGIAEKMKRMLNTS